ncbi:hypothetical protein MtrunA17_Chr5g0396131 [Medicago truncatula]|uniref:Uncharacterized protein n=1 Tax=Medicago truncatula TaxID=3880 RepID=A0A396HM04_MEDTR|nr:hypothetical protein MtrunA17_Chr5g0396131 [Medicago truncatula]
MGLSDQDIVALSGTTPLELHTRSVLDLRAHGLLILSFLTTHISRSCWVVRRKAFFSCQVIRHF